MDQNEIIAAIDKTIKWLESDPDNLIRGTLACDEQGFTIAPYRDEACEFCTLGYISKNLPDLRLEDTFLVIDTIGTTKEMNSILREIYTINDVWDNKDERIDALIDKLSTLRALIQKSL